ncbi:MAG: SMC-Scp complex subunit ScpB [Candidatus Hermodarchaeota archaeon]
MEENPENNFKDETEKGYEEIEENHPFEDLESDSLLEEKAVKNQESESNLKFSLIESEREATNLDEQSLKQQVREFHRNLIEASLYAAGSPLTIEEISTKLEFPKKEVEELVNELAFDYLERSTALVIAQIGDRFQMQIRPEYTEKVSKFAKGGAIAEKYLRTLTVIALKQPILKSTLIKIRGTGAYEHVKYLIDNGFIDAVKKGRSHALTTTDKYADMFGLPKDKTELKRAMVTQLGVEDLSVRESQVENEEELTSEPELETEESLNNQVFIEGEEEEKED